MTSSDNIYVARLHWVLFLSPFLLGCSALVLGIMVVQLQMVALLVLGVSLLWGGMSVLNYYCSSLTIQKKHVIFRTGILVRKITDIPFSKIESIDVKQSIIGSILRYGILTITGTGGTQHTIYFLDKPLTCRRYMEQALQQL